MRALTQRSRDATVGFSLIELVVAILVLVVGVLGSASVLGSATSRQVRSNELIDITAAAESKLDELRAFSLTSSGDSMKLTVGGSLTSPEVDHADTTTSARGRALDRRWLVTSGRAGTRYVTLRVQPRVRIRGALRYMDYDAMYVIVR